MQAKEMIEGKLSQKLMQQSNVARGIGKKVALVLDGEGGGTWVVDCTSDPATLTAGTDAAAAATISMAVSVFEQMASGEISPQSAFLTGKVKVQGDLGAAIKLGQLLV